MKTLIVVDVQHDFIDPTGNLYVPGAEKVVPEIAKLIETDKEIEQVIFTVDWHSPEHCSFKDNGGIWPVHCLQYTQGSTIPNVLILVCVQRGFLTVDSKFDLDPDTVINKKLLTGTFDIYQKGDASREEEYGALAYTTEMDKDDDSVEFTNISQTSYAHIPVDSDIIVSGVAGDYCVLETLKNIMGVPELKGTKYVFLPGIASMDDGTTLKEYCEENNILVYEKSK